jgi:hypothetical protein
MFATVWCTVLIKYIYLQVLAMWMVVWWIVVIS